MKTTTVPAQFTTIEDRVAGNLSLNQLMLLTTPIFISCVIYMIFPPFTKLSILKLVISLIIFLSFSVLAVRIRGKIILLWIQTILKYRNSPRYYVFNKNDNHLRQSVKDIENYKTNNTKSAVSGALSHQDKSSYKNTTKLKYILLDPRSDFKINRKKGVMNVYINKIQ